MNTKRPEALRLAEWLAGIRGNTWPSYIPQEAAAELRRQHAEIETLRAGYDAARLEIESLKERVQQGQLARDVNSRRVTELEAQLEAVGAGGEGKFAVAHPTQDRAVERDELLQAAINFIQTLTGMTPPPIEVAPPEVFAPFRAFVEKIQEITDRRCAASVEPLRKRECLHKISEPVQPVAQDAARLINWFDEEDGFSQGTKAPHKWVLQAHSELIRLRDAALALAAPAQAAAPIKTLEEAIAHAEDKAKGNSACAMEHAKLAAWLTELQLLRADRAARGAAQSAECGNCLDGETDRGHTCRKCGGTGVAQAAPVGMEPVYQIGQPFLFDPENTWRDASKDAYDVCMPNRRRIIYTAAQVQAMLAAAPRNATLYDPDDVAFPVQRCADGTDALPPELASIAAAEVAAPSAPARTPLTDRQIGAVINEVALTSQYGHHHTGRWMDFARAIEAAHGITAAQKGGQHGTE